MTKNSNICGSDIYVADGKDSTVYKYETVLGTQAYKIYKDHISIALLQDYYALHTLLSQHNFLCMQTKLSYKNQKVEYIQRSILPLAIETIALCSDRQTRKEHTISSIPYVPGETFYEGLIHLDSGHNRSTLILELENLFQDNIIQACPALKPDNKREKFIDLHNIKITGRENGILKCIITDLGKSIVKLLDIKKKRDTRPLKEKHNIL